MSRTNPLSELARLGFEELSESIPKLDKLVELVGDWGHSALDPLAKSASPDRALDSLLKLAEVDSKTTKRIVSNPDAALRLIRVLGASDALAEFLQRQPSELELFLTKAMLPVDSEVSSQDRSSLRISYRSALLRITDFDLSAPDPLAAYESVARAFRNSQMLLSLPR